LGAFPRRFFDHQLWRPGLIAFVLPCMLGQAGVLANGLHLNCA
jgi:hypothetical protein